MIGLLRADFRKLVHRWMPRILILILLALTALIFFAVSHRVRFRPDLVPPDGLVAALSLAGGFAPFIWPILAGSWAGGEYSWGTIRVSLTRLPGRIAFTLSGLIMVLLTIGFTLLLMLGVGAGMGAIIGAVTNTSAFSSPFGVSASTVIIKMFFATWFVSAFYAVLAYTAAVALRSVPAGVGIGIGFSVAQSAMLAIFTALGDPWKTIAQHFPDGYGESLTSRIAGELIVTGRGPFSGSASSGSSITEAIIGLAVYIAILLAVMLAVVKTRDVTV